jgi:hypothetical protein
VQLWLGQAWVHWLGQAWVHWLGLARVHWLELAWVHWLELAWVHWLVQAWVEQLDWVLEQVSELESGGGTPSTHATTAMRVVGRPFQEYGMTLTYLACTRVANMLVTFVFLSVFAEKIAPPCTCVYVAPSMEMFTL